jgi:Peptidase family M28
MSEKRIARYGIVKSLPRGFLIFVVVAACLAPQGLSQRRRQGAPQPGKRQGAAQVRKTAPTIQPEILAALDRISADSLRGHLSFIASDLLEGRNTPSRGLDIAAEYIAAQFRGAGLEPAGDAGSKSYFQTSEWSVGPSKDGFVELSVDDGQQKMRARASQLAALGVKVEPQADGTNGDSEKPVVKLRNVAGLLRGSDPALKDSYVIVSAHYDHIGVQSTGEGDRINNGANDDGSGTVSVIELASALASLKQRPKRSIVFIAWFGEEKGLHGSRYYARHPLFPLEKTVAMVNLEHLGRTDDIEGPKLNSATLTGFDFTDLGPIFRAAGEKTGIDVYKNEKNSDAFFSRSDNQALADAGIPAHTLCVAFIFPDYHKPGDHWEKIDYANLARVNRTIALALLTIADNAEPPKWNELNPKTEKYVKAWKALHKKSISATNEHK